jgi:uncharacterized membrane protein YuzA (DUF378 family)
MDKAPVMRMIGKAAWLLTALASIHVGAVALFGTEYDMIQKYVPEVLVQPLYIAYLVAGVYSLVMLFMHCRCCD